ncbi:hypothetical protein F4823DRAFT_632606 [Ustulina deusta]|nr:hypothetical protein F4823DRAFT_632606 [Ustulina deusta]
MASSSQAVEAAWKRASNAKRSRIEGLASELQLLIIEKLPDCSSIVNFALTGPELYTIVTEHEAKLAEEAVVSAIGKHLMPFAAALYELDVLGDRLPRAFLGRRHLEPEPGALGPVIDILNRHIGVDNTDNWHKESRVTKLSVGLRYFQLYAAVDYWAQILAPGALDSACRMKRDRNSAAGDLCLKPTNTEMARFYKALYLFQIVSIAFPWESPEEGGHSQAWARFCAQVSPWEMEQTRNLHLLLILNVHCTRNLLALALQRPGGPVTLRIMYAFVLTQGLPRLSALHKQGRDAKEGDNAYKTFSMSVQFPRAINTRIIAFHSKLDVDKFGYDADDNTHLVARGIFERYPEEERGPKAWWYYRFLDMHAQFEGGMWRFQPWFRCNACLPLNGYAFWDFETLSKLGYQGKSFHEPNDLLDYANRRTTSHSRDSLTASVVEQANLGLRGCQCHGR